MRKLLIDMPELRSSKQKNLLNLSKLNRKSPTIKKDSSNIFDQVRINVEKVLSKYKGRVVVLRSENDVAQYFDNAISSGYIAIDTETTGLDHIKDNVVGTCLYYPGGKAAYIPHLHKSYLTGSPLNNQVSYDFVKQQLQRVIDSHIQVLMHNADFDMRFIYYSMGIKVPCTWDTQIASRVINNTESAALKFQYAKHIEHTEKSYDYSKLFKNVEYTKVSPDVAALYASIDALLTYELYEYQKQVFEQSGNEALYSVFKNIEMPLVSVVFDIEVQGVCIDKEMSQKLSEKYTKLLNESHKKVMLEVRKYQPEIDRYNSGIIDIKKRLPNPINISSPSQLATLFYDVLKITPKTNKARSTDEEALTKIGTPLCKYILEYRGLLKLLTTYIDKLPECVAQIDNRLHASFIQIGADTGRFSSQNPNLQNIPSKNQEIRKIFTASPGYVLVGGDFSQQEPRLLAKYSGDEHMLQAYIDGKDLYAMTASKIYNTTYENCLEFYPDGSTNKEGKKRRSSVKSVILGLMYGRGVASIAEQIGGTTQEAQGILDNFYASFPKVKQWMENVYKSVSQKGYSETLWGRRRYFPDMQLPEYSFSYIEPIPSGFNPLTFDSELTSEVPKDVSNRYAKQLRAARGKDERRNIMENARKNNIKIVDNTGKIAEAKRQCVNAMIQGGAADMSKLAMLNVVQDKRLEELGFRMLILVHDEIIGECPQENAKECGELLKKAMCNAPKTKIPEMNFKVDISYTKCWYGEEISV